MIYEIPERELDIRKLLPHIVGGGASNTNGMPLIIFLDDKTVLKITPHFKTDYDLALERRNETPKQWQGVNSAIISSIIADKVPGENGLGSNLGSCIVRGKTKDIVDELVLRLLGTAKVKPVDGANRYYFIGQYFDKFMFDINTGKAYDEFVVLRMPEYYGFLSNLYALPPTIGLYDVIIRAALFEVSFYYYKIKKYLPSFQHNDLHMENVMIHPERKTETVVYRKFIFDDDEFYVPYFGYSLRIIDLGLSAIPDMGINSTLDNSVIISDTADRGHETKFLLRFISMNPTTARDILGDNEKLRDKYITEGFTLDDELFKGFRQKRGDIIDVIQN